MLCSCDDEDEEEGHEWTRHGLRSEDVDRLDRLDGSDVAREAVIGRRVGADLDDELRIVGEVGS